MKTLTAYDAETRSIDTLAENIAYLRALFPDAFADEKIDFDVLKQLLGGLVDEREERYGLNWHGKRRARQLALTPSTGTLRPCPQESVDWETTRNLMIEGDNLEVLKLLQKPYAGRVKLIYIDPPYNTGSDLIYHDNYVDSIRHYMAVTRQAQDGRVLTTSRESSGRFHTRWLNMMYPRLKLARSLLCSDGLIFVSIDDSEACALKLIMNELFGEENFVCQICVQSNPRGKQSEVVATSHEYVMCYARNVDEIAIGQALSEAQQQQYCYALPDGRRYRTRGLRHRGNASRRVDRPNMFYPVYVDPDTRRVSLERSDAYSEKVLPKKSSGEDGRWEWGPETARERLDRLEGVFIRGRNEWDIYQREFIEDEDGITRSLKWKSIWSEKEINYQNARNELKELFGEDPPFDYPKPTYLIRKIVEGTTRNDDIVMDFFAGSGTTAHAVMAQNAADAGNRHYVIVQLPEALDDGSSAQAAAVGFCRTTGRPLNIAELTKERLRRSGEKIERENPTLEGDVGFRVFKLDSSNIQAWEPNRENLAEALEASVEHLKADRTEADILYELLLKLGLDLCVPIEERTIAGKKVQTIGGGVLLACLATTITGDDVEPLGQGIVEWHATLAPAGETTCVFRDSAFADDVAKTNLAAILQQHGLQNVRSL